MPSKKFLALVKKYQGWIENQIARFPSVWHKQQFEKEFNWEFGA